MCMYIMIREDHFWEPCLHGIPFGIFLHSSSPCRLLCRELHHSSFQVSGVMLKFPADWVAVRRKKSVKISEDLTASLDFKDGWVSRQ